MKVLDKIHIDEIKLLRMEYKKGLVVNAISGLYFNPHVMQI